MSNIEKLVDFIMERDEDGKLFERFCFFLEMGLYRYDPATQGGKVSMEHPVTQEG